MRTVADMMGARKVCAHSKLGAQPPEEEAEGDVRDGQSRRKSGQQATERAEGGQCPEEGGTKESKATRGQVKYMLGVSLANSASPGPTAQWGQGCTV